jgi:hypothetical protein
VEFTPDTDSKNLVLVKLWRESQEVKALGLPGTPRTSIHRCMPAEFEQTRFVGMQCQAESREALAQVGAELLSVVLVLEPHDEVIGETDDHNVAVRLLLTPSVSPKIEDIVQVDVGQQRTDTAGLAPLR